MGGLGRSPPPRETSPGPPPARTAPPGPPPLPFPAPPAVDDVVAIPAGETVGRAHAALGVQAIAPDDVVARPAGDHVRAMGAQQGVVALCPGLPGAARGSHPGDPGR